MDEHTDDLRNVNEGDELIIETTTGESLDLTCVEREVEHASEAAQRAGIIRETTFWYFDLGGETVVATIVDGLEGTEDVDLPQHSALWNMDAEQNHGYAESINLLGAVSR